MTINKPSVKEWGTLQNTMFEIAGGGNVVVGEVGWGPGTAASYYRYTQRGRMYYCA